MPAGSRETRVAGYERSLQQLGERDVDGVVDAQVVAELPCAVEERTVWVSPNSELRRIDAGIGGTIAAELARGHESSQCVCHLDIDEMRCMELTAP